jgi:hypothetical protein
MPFSPMEQGVTPTFSDFWYVYGCLFELCVECCNNCSWSPQTPQITSAPTEIFPAASPLPVRCAYAVVSLTDKKSFIVSMNSASP